jgi:hypothetical protein
MSRVQDRREPSTDTPGRETTDVKLEVVVIPVSDVDRVVREQAGEELPS